MWGLTLDTIVSIDVVLANGTIAKASNTINPDLFWVALYIRLPTIEDLNSIHFTGNAWFG